MKPRFNPLNALLAVVSLAYPLLAIFLLRFVEPYWLIVALATLLIARLLLGAKSAPVAIIAATLAAVTCLSVVALFDAQLAVRLYPVCMNAAMLVAFAATLVWPPSMIERFARILEPDLPESGIRYTRIVTMVWCGFLVVNLAIALWTALFATLQVWAIYNGGVAYALMGVLFAGEFIVRQFVRRAEVPSLD